MAPEAVTERGPAGEQLDVFSLGAIAFHLFSGRPPASGFVEMTERLRREQGLRISSVLDGAGESLQLLVQYATHPEATTRLGSAGDFLKELEHVEEELTRPDARSRPDPVEARPEDELDHGLVVKRRLGKGSTALALLVKRDGREHVLKVALSAEHNDRLRAEADVLRRLRHQYVVELHDDLTFKDRAGGERVGLLMARAGEATLADRLREEGRLHLELLERSARTCWPPSTGWSRRAFRIATSSPRISARPRSAGSSTWCSSTSPWRARRPRTSWRARATISIRSCRRGSRRAGTRTPNASRLP